MGLPCETTLPPNRSSCLIQLGPAYLRCLIEVLPYGSSKTYSFSLIIVSSDEHSINVIIPQATGKPIRVWVVRSEGWQFCAQVYHLPIFRIILGLLIHSFLDKAFTLLFRPGLLPYLWYITIKASLNKRSRE